MTDFSNFFDNPFKILFLYFVILLFLMWLFLPFAIYGLRNRLERIVCLLEEISLKISEKKDDKTLSENDVSSSITREK